MHSLSRFIQKYDLVFLPEVCRITLPGRVDNDRGIRDFLYTTFRDTRTKSLKGDELIPGRAGNTICEGAAYVDPEFPLFFDLIHFCAIHISKNFVAIPRILVEFFEFPDVDLRMK
jgi:hypothetical protein